MDHSTGRRSIAGWRAVLVVLTGVSLVVTACQAGPSPTPTGGDKPYAGVTLNLLMEDLTETNYIEDLLPDFEAKTGIKVVFEKVPYSNMYEKLVPQLSGPEKSGSYDVVAVDYYWPGEFARSAGCCRSTNGSPGTRPT